VNCSNVKAKHYAKIEHVPGRRCYTRMTQDNDATGPHVIPLDIERSLTDDFAFIAVSQPQVDSVSAVAMEQHKTSHSLSFRFAANEGVTFVVREHFDRLFAVLKSHARKGDSTMSNGTTSLSLAYFRSQRYIETSVSIGSSTS
jgi:hypothetical protein